MEEGVRVLIERERVAKVVNALFTATDRRDWQEVRNCFTDRVTFDMTSLVGGAVQELSPADIAAGWESGLKPIDAVHHQTGNLSITVNGTWRTRLATVSHITIDTRDLAEIRECLLAATSSSSCCTKVSGVSGDSASW